MLKFYNTLSRKKEVFLPLTKKGVNLFVCGPTVYDFSHIGHARTYIVFDALVKYLRQRGFKVSYLQNITDIDDKIINRAKEEKIEPKKLAEFFEKEYLKDMKTLGVNSVTKYAKATSHIKEIISQVKRLLEKGFAYKIKDGIYYDISKFKDYGKLSGRTILQAEDAISRIDEAKEKRNKGDFCLWKYAKSSMRIAQPSPKGSGYANAPTRIINGEPAWFSPFGWGWSGWHIEDTAITEKYFGPQYDIHGGARDLIFPHHEAEICQMEAISGKKPMVKYWLHTGFLTVEGQKMAKSLGNFITIRDFLKKYSPRILRLLVLKTHYRSPIDYNEKLIQQTKKELEKIDEFVEKLQEIAKKRVVKFLCGRIKTELNLSSKNLILTTKKRFEKALEDDFNTPGAIASVFKLVNKGNALFAKNKITPKEAKEILNFLKKVDEIFNFIFWQKPKKAKIPKEILKLVNLREKYRKEKNWQKADSLRGQIEAKGYRIEDADEGPSIKKNKRAR